jgi:hypothetical protein
MVKLKIYILALGVCLANWQLNAAEVDVDLKLVLLIDVSSSVDSVESRLQRKGYVDAMTDPSVLKAITKGRLGRIAITYVEWAGARNHSVLAPWTVIEDFASVFAFATLIEEAPRSSGEWTSISGALTFGALQFEKISISSDRKTMDISTDGPNNDGPSPALARDSAIAEGITINGLPIVNNRLQISGMKQMPNYDHYFADCVIGGRNAFMVIADDYQDFARAIKKKLIFEIADRMPPGYRHFAQRSYLVRAAEMTRPSCDAGIDYKREGTPNKRRVY